MRKMTSIPLLLLVFLLSFCVKKESRTSDLTSLTISRAFPSKAAAGSKTNPVVMPLENTPYYFRVKFNGLITIAKMAKGGDDTPRRAILVGGNKHVPTLVVDYPADDADRKKLTQELRDWTGHTPICPDPRFQNLQCSVDITGADLEIRDIDDGQPVSPIQYDNPRSFEHLLPSLATLADDPHNPGRNVIRDELLVAANLPSGPASAFVEIDGGGLLQACAFDDGDAFDNDPDHCQPFAEDTYWSGATSKVAVLKIRSKKTNNAWYPLDVKNSGLLSVLILNEPEGAKPDPSHFAMYDNILRGGHVPHVIGKKCKPSKVFATCSGTSGVVFVPGCSDTRWP
jgi:hypothetical protein